MVLVGYSFGARMIFGALEHLATRKVCVRECVGWGWVRVDMGGPVGVSVEGLG